MSNNQPNKLEYDVCAIYGICSISPALSFLQEVALVFIETLAFYLLEVEKFGFSNKNIRKDLIDAFSGPSTNVEYSQENLNNLIVKLYEDLFQTKEIYKIICKEKNITPIGLKSSIKVFKKFNLSDAIKQGQKGVLKHKLIFDESQKKMLDVLLIILKSICLYIIELQELNVNIDDAYKEFLSALSIMTMDTAITDKIDETIKRAVNLDNELMQKTFDARKAEFGNIMVADVSYSTREGKALLVTGANMKELESVLKASQGKGIDVYTHGQMIVGHTYPKLKAYPHLVGHYGKGVEHCIADFSSFPGAIYLSKLSLYQIGQLYHGRIFTSDKISQSGITSLRENDFEPLIQSALSADGFTKPVQKENIRIGMVEEEFFEKVYRIIDKIEAKKIKHLFAIGVSNNEDAQRQYFEKFLELMEDDCFVISASYTNNRENVLSFNMDYVFPFAYKTIKILKQRKIFDDLNTTIFFTHCEPHTVPNLFMMRAIGVKNIYFDSCPSNLINPAIIDALRDPLNLKKIINPQKDFEEIVNRR